ncbi:hypothetical protein K1719_040779 [Acacia pycnantha]|nr:hypothetical protein K1719_040779 [Acacia pycnantha]
MMMEEIMVENIRNNTEFENLPQSLIHHIMNYVPYNDAVKFSVLSKTLHSMCLSYPVLDFDYTFFSGQHGDPHRTFLSFILETLYNHCPHINKPLQRLRVKYPYDYDRAYFPFHSVFEGFLYIVIENHAKEIIFDIWTYRLVDVSSDSLLSLFSSQFLTMLNLKNFRFPVANFVILCPKLKELVISSCEGAKTITVSSPYVEKVSKQLMELVTDSLYIEECHLPKSLRFHNPSIKVLEMNNNHKVKNMSLLAPNLKHFVYHSSKCSVDILVCGSLKVLKLERVSITNEFVRSTISDLSCLRELAIDCHELEKMELKNDKLEILSLKRCYNLKEAVVDAP